MSVDIASCIFQWNFALNPSFNTKQLWDSCLTVVFRVKWQLQRQRAVRAGFGSHWIVKDTSSPWHLGYISSVKKSNSLFFFTVKVCVFWSPNKYISFLQLNLKLPWCNMVYNQFLLSYVLLLRWYILKRLEIIKEKVQIRLSFTDGYCIDETM